jgi:hypothetical protein
VFISSRNGDVASVAWFMALLFALPLMVRTAG